MTPPEEIVPDSVEVGNTASTSPPKKTQGNACVHWCFTWNNYQFRDIECLKDLFSTICAKYAFQEEIGIEGKTPHLQGTISLKQKARFTEFSPAKVIHWEKVKDLAASYEYCTKFDTRKPGTFPYCMNYTPKREIQYFTGEWYPWQKRCLEVLNSPPNIRDIYWFWSEHGGTGKSTFFRHLIGQLNCLPICTGKHADLMNIVFNAKDLDNCPAVVIDLPRACGNKISYTALECIKSGVIVNTKYETGHKIINFIHIVVFANAPPDLDNKMSNERWIVECIDI